MPLNMSTKDLEFITNIREWTPMTDVMERIPAHVQRGFFSTDLNITCVDAVSDFLALGSDAGIVFWYNRQTGAVQKLRTEVATRITCVKIVDSVEYMVAAGSSNGQVSVFQIQKPLPPDLNLVAPCARAKPTERYTIRDLHRGAISCCEWSKNGMKLYTGDRAGIVVLTELDYQMHLTKSVEILSESYEIVQLSVYKSYLLVSTLYRSLLCERAAPNGEWQLTQIGKKDRKHLTDCGGILLKSQSNQKPPLVLCGRPGLRFWISDTAGNVERTLLFKEAVAKSPLWDIPILNPKMLNNQRVPPTIQYSTTESIQTAKNFGVIHRYGNRESSLLIVTHDEESLYILNMERLCVEAVAKGFRKIMDFCVCGEEIFVLEGERSLLRLAPAPEKPNKIARVIFNPLLPHPVPYLGNNLQTKVESPVEPNPDELRVVSAEECFELPPVERLNLNIPIELAVESPRVEQQRRVEIFNQISSMDFDDSILHHSGISLKETKRRKSREQNPLTRSTGIVEIGHVVSTADDNQSSIKENLRSAKSHDNIKINDEDDNTMKISLQSATSVEEKIINQPMKGDGAKPDATSPTTTCTTDISIAKEKLAQLSVAYPTLWEDAGVQTSPRKQIYYLEETSEGEDGECEGGDYSAGQPVDDICQVMRAATLVDNLTDLKTNHFAAPPPTPVLPPLPIQQPVVSDEINSFLLDFSRARSPFDITPRNN